MKKFLLVIASAILSVLLFACGCSTDLPALDWRDGRDGHDVTIEEIYEKYVKEYGDISYADFLKEYLNYTNTELDEVTGLKSKINKSLMSGVTIYSTFSYSAGYGVKYNNVYTGSGAIIWFDGDAGDAYVVTNCHVVYDDASTSTFCEDVRLYLYGQDEYGVNYTITETQHFGYTSMDITGDEKYRIEATVIGASQEYDLALLEVKGSSVLKKNKDEIVVAEFSTERDVEVGQTVYTIGNASGEGMSASSGIISKDSEDIQLVLTSSDYLTEDDYITYRVMRITAPINPGNSGGALYNKDGKIIGIVNSKDETEGIDNMGYALPGDSAKRILQLMYDNYKENGYRMPSNGGMNKALLGITTEVFESYAKFDETAVSDSYAKFDEITGTAKIIQHIRVDTVSSAPARGNLQRGDYLTAVEIIGSDGKVKVEKFDITRKYHLSEVMFSVRLGDTVVLTLERNGEEQPLEVRIKFDRSIYFTKIA